MTGRNKSNKRQQGTRTTGTHLILPSAVAHVTRFFARCRSTASPSPWRSLSHNALHLSFLTLCPSYASLKVTCSLPRSYLERSTRTHARTHAHAHTCTHPVSPTRPAAQTAFLREALSPWQATADCPALQTRHISLPALVCDSLSLSLIVNKIQLYHRCVSRPGRMPGIHRRCS